MWTHWRLVSVDLAGHACIHRTLDLRRHCCGSTRRRRRHGRSDERAGVRTPRRDPSKTLSTRASRCIPSEGPVVARNTAAADCLTALLSSYRLTGKGLWHDEAFTLAVASGGRVRATAVGLTMVRIPATAAATAIVATNRSLIGAFVRRPRDVVLHSPRSAPYLHHDRSAVAGITGYTTAVRWR